METGNQTSNKIVETLIATEQYVKAVWLDGVGSGPTGNKKWKQFKL